MQRHGFHVRGDEKSMIPVSIVLDKAECIARSPEQGADKAAQYLAPYRREAAELLREDKSYFPALLQIVLAQMRYLNDAQKPDLSAGAAEWFLHVFHHIEDASQDEAWKKIKLALSDTFSGFFRTYACSLHRLDRVGEMREAMRMSLDLTADLPLGIVYLVHLYGLYLSRSEAEGKPAKGWLLDRYAECLAMLDYSGSHDTAFRTALDEYQYALRVPEQKTESWIKICALAESHPEDIALQTLKNLFKAHHSV